MTSSCGSGRGTEAVRAPPESGHLVILQSPLDFSSTSALQRNATSLSLRAVKSRARSSCASRREHSCFIYPKPHRILLGCSVRPRRRPHPPSAPVCHPLSKLATRSLCFNPVAPAPSPLLRYLSAKLGRAESMRTSRHARRSVLHLTHLAARSRYDAGSVVHCLQPYANNCAI